jgi:hypothetical protein
MHVINQVGLARPAAEATRGLGLSALGTGHGSGHGGGILAAPDRGRPDRGEGLGPLARPADPFSSLNLPAHHVRERSDHPFCLSGDEVSPPNEHWGRNESGRAGSPPNPSTMPRP